MDKIFYRPGFESICHCKTLTNAIENSRYTMLAGTTVLYLLSVTV